MKKLAFIMLLSASSFGSTFSQCPPPLSWLEIIDEPANGYVMGCDIIEFKWSIDDGLLPNGIIEPIDAQVAFYTDMYELVDIEWNDAQGLGDPGHIIEYEDVPLWGEVANIRVNDYDEGLPAEGTLLLRPIDYRIDVRSRIIHNSRFSLSDLIGGVVIINRGISKLLVIFCLEMYLI